MLKFDPMFVPSFSSPRYLIQVAEVFPVQFPRQVGESNPRAPQARGAYHDYVMQSTKMRARAAV